MLSVFTSALLALSLILPRASAQTRRANLPRAQTCRPSEPVAAAWYAGWHATTGFPLSDISWEKYNTLIYSFALTTPDVHELTLDGSEPSVFPQFVSEAHDHGVAAHISIGGWTGSRWFSSNVATAANRTAFVKTVIDFAEQYNVDGINFDWETPNGLGIGCNTITTLIVPFMDATGSPLTDVSAFADVLDYIAILNYDVWGSWSSAVGPNAPLDDTCAAPANQVGSAASAVKSWTTAGMPANKIVLGVASYGHSFSVSPSDAFVNNSKTELAPYPKFNATNQPLGDVWDDTGSVNTCGVFQGPGGIFNFWGLVDGGFLTCAGDPAPGINYRYDICSVTGSFIKETGLAGFAMWQAGGDYNDLSTLSSTLRNKTTDATGSPLTDVSGFADVLDYIIIMNMMSGDRGLCHRTQRTSQRTCAAPANQLLTGHSFSVSPSNAFVDASKTELAAPHGDAWDSTGGVDVCGVYGGAWRIFDFWGLVDVRLPSPPKGNYIKETGLAGFAMWQAGGDYNDILLDAIKSAINSSTQRRTLRRQRKLHQ
ncbi:glycoside hydrolase superfamily [Melanogaster broomeanus]|nr:glycoside hydrolase superfamily [Melanogaster broomeanus]